MNLNSIAGPLVSVVNPWTPATLQISSGSQINPDGSQTARFYQPGIPVSAQVQAMSTKDLRQTDHLNLQGQSVSIYLNGELDGLVRVSNKGGDLVSIATGPHAGVYLVVMVLEQWNDWVKVAATLQNGS